MESSPGGSPPKRHSRQGSSGRALPRRSTRGPLDMSDPSANPLSTPTKLTHQQSSQLLSPTGSQYHTPRLPSPTPGSNLSNMSFKTAHSTIPAPQRDFSSLLRPEIYHPLTLLDVPPAFRVSTSQPDPSTSLPILITTGHFRSAAIKAAQLLTSPTISPSDHTTIFSLIYTRLSCLTLCNQTPLAAQEVKCLEDLNSSYYRDEMTGEPLVPWHLRVLAVRLQGMGYADARRGVMGFYDLAREARLSLTSLKKARASPTTEESLKAEIEKEITTWEERLNELGIRVASALIEMEDLEGAARFLSTLHAGATPTSSGSQLQMQKSLLYLCLGDVDAARACITLSSSSNDNNEEREKEKKVILALAHMADAHFSASVVVWEDLISSSISTENPLDSSSDGESDRDGEEMIAMWKQNLAVCYLYLGRMDEARTLLEHLITEHYTFHALTFNLSTIYELCTERSRALKIGLVETIAEMVDSEGKGTRGEKVNGDFKL